MEGLFVTGTDTGVGKTLAAAALMHALRARGSSVAGMKPVASGCEATPAGLRSPDALALQARAGGSTPYELVNPYAFAEPAAPHLLAAEAGVSIEPGRIVRSAETLSAGFDCLVVEGVGGWLVPIGSAATMADVAEALGLPVVMVVGVRLGCLNHALLTAEAVRARGLRVAGWVANRLEPGAPRAEDNIVALRERLGAPCLGVVPPLAAPSAAAAAAYLDLSPLGAVGVGSHAP
ncbi:MAG: dethiobiotin synthase [Gammaproteobacteria bacterium]|nr:dethiobiotin synthase [Gammaproteobacteria bacterium]